MEQFAGIKIYIICVEAPNTTAALCQAQPGSDFPFKLHCVALNKHFCPNMSQSEHSPSVRLYTELLVFHLLSNVAAYYN